LSSRSRGGASSVRALKRRFDLDDDYLEDLKEERIYAKHPARDKVGDEVYRQRLLNSLGWLHMELGDLDKALDLDRHGAERARKRGDSKTIANAEINLGDIFLAQCDLVLA
jgi:hypothetical protein